MAIVLSCGAARITPVLRIGYDGVSVKSNNTVHAILGRAIPDVSLAPDSLRSGNLKLLFADAPTAWTAHRLLAVTVGVWVLADDLEGVNMRFIRDGKMSPTQGDDRTTWELEVGFQEVGP